MDNLVKELEGKRLECAHLETALQETCKHLATSLRSFLLLLLSTEHNVCLEEGWLSGSCDAFT